MRFSLSCAFLVAGLSVGPPALASEVVWLDVPSREDALRVAIAADAERAPLSPAAFRSLPVDRRPTDGTAVATLETALERVRVHEEVLDGELLILGGLQTPLESVRILRDKADRDVVVRALLYQGFAVDRFWGETLGTAPESRPWRTRIDDAWVERPWLDAFALDPLRSATDADITEAPQRAAYDQLRRTLARVTRASIVADDLPSGATLYLDGEPQVFDGPFATEVLPGRHWVHVEHEGHILAQHAIRVAPAERFVVELAVPEEAWLDLVKVLHGSGEVVPTAIVGVLPAFDGEVWFAEGSGATLRAWSVTADGVRRQEIDGVQVETSSGAWGAVSVAGWAGPSWLNSGDFRAQDPGGVPEGAGVVNSLAPHVGVELAWDRAWLRYGLGVDATVPLGTYHVALTGPDGRQRVRPYPHVFVGHPLVQASVGILFPYHVVGGLQTAVPLGEQGLELRGFARAGATTAQVRADGSSWRGEPILQAGVGIGVRLKP